jgi:hypothetical protein
MNKLSKNKSKSKTKTSFIDKIKSFSNKTKTIKHKSSSKSFRKSSSKIINNVNNLNKLISPLQKLKKSDKKIKEYCEFYNKDIFGNPAPELFNSCKINKFCRKTKCKNIDKKFKLAQIKELGSKYQARLASSVDKKCLHIVSNKNYKNCKNKATRKFYQENKLGELYDKMLECDNKTCAKERKIFYTNLFRINKKKKGPKMLIDDELPPDQYLIETN